MRHQGRLRPSSLSLDRLYQGRDVVEHVKIIGELLSSIDQKHTAHGIFDKGRACPATGGTKALIARAFSKIMDFVIFAALGEMTAPIFAGDYINSCALPNLFQVTPLVIHRDKPD